VVFQDGIARYLLNSAVVASTSSTVAVLLGSMAAYGLSRFQYPVNLNWHLVVWFLSARMFPPIVQVIPFVSMFHSANLLDSRTALAMLYAAMNTPFVVWMMMGFVQEIPREVEELGQLLRFA